MCAIAAVPAATALIAMFAPAPAAGEEATSSTTGRRRLPSTSPTSPPPSATRKHQTASRASSTARSVVGGRIRRRCCGRPSAPGGALALRDVRSRPPARSASASSARLVAWTRSSTPTASDGRCVRRAAGRAHAPARPATSSSGRSTCSAPGSALRTAIEQGRPHSMILHGPPGSGKTTLARIVAASADAAFEELSAVQAGRPEVREVLETRRGAPPRRARHDLLPRRDPPLQQGPAGRAAAGRRGGARDADRRDDGEPVVRGQRRAALARARLRAGGADGGARAHAAAARARARRVRRGARGGRRGRAARRARRRRRAHRARGAGAGVQNGARGRRHAGARGGRAAAADPPLRPRRRPPLRHDLRLDQVDARVRPRRLALLPRGDAGGRRGPALHRAADGDPRERGRRQRRPAGARASRPRRPRRSIASACRRRSSRSRRPRSTCRSRRSPTRPSARSAPRAASCASTAPSRRRCSCAPAGAARATTARTATRATSASRRSRRPDAVGERFYAPDEAEAALAERLREIRRARGREP